MKIIKLPYRYVLAQHGFTHALRFDHENKQSAAIKKALYQIHHGKNPWNIHWKWSNPQAPWGYYQERNRRLAPYWIGVRDQRDLTAAILKACYE